MRTQLKGASTVALAVTMSWCLLVPPESDCSWQDRSRLDISTSSCASIEDSQEALAACREAVQAGLLESGKVLPETDRFYLRLGLALERLGRYSDALRVYRAAVRLFPSRSELHYRLGVVLVRHYDAYEEALGPISEAVRRGIEVCDAHELLGEIDYRMGRHDEARIAFLSALADRPNSVPSLTGLGRALIALGRQKEAVNAVRRAVKLAPDNADAQLALAEALVEAREAAVAIPHFRAAIARDQVDARPAYCGLARALTLLGREAEARQACENALKPAKGDHAAPKCACSR